MSSSDAKPNRLGHTLSSIEAVSDNLIASCDGDRPTEPAVDRLSTGRPLRRQELERRLQSSPADLAACVELADIYRHENRPADAVRILRKASEFHSDDPDFQWAYEEALLVCSLQQLREVTALADRLGTIEAEQEKERCETNWAVCRIDICRARLQRDPRNQRLRLTLAQALKELERFDEAIKEAATATHDPRYAATAHLMQAQCLDAIGKPIEALPAYRAAALRRSNPAPARIRVIAMRAATEIAVTLGFDVSAQRYRRFLRHAEAELKKQPENSSEEIQPPHDPTWLECDTAAEKLVAEYESVTLKTREELNRLNASFRRAHRQERGAVIRKVEDRRNAVQNLYDRRKAQPVKQQRKECSRLDKAMAEVDQAIEEVRTIVVRRLDHLPEVVPLAEADWAAKPESVREAEEAIRRASRQIQETGRQLLVSTPARFVDTFWILPSICGLFLAIWTVLAFIIKGPQPWLALASGILIAFFLFPSMLGVLQIPLRRQTRQIYPRAEHLYSAAHRAREAGKAIAAATAAEEAADLVKHRNSQLRAAERWKAENLAAIDQAFEKNAPVQRQPLEQELETIRQRFRKRFDELDRTIEEKADGIDT